MVSIVASAFVDEDEAREFFGADAISSKAWVDGFGVTEYQTILTTGSAPPEADSFEEAGSPCLRSSSPWNEVGSVQFDEGALRRWTNGHEMGDETASV